MKVAALKGTLEAPMWLTTGNFEAGPGGWRPVNHDAAVSLTVVNNSAQAKQESSFLRFSTSVPGGSIAEDGTLPLFVTSVVAVGTGQPAVGYGLPAAALSFTVWLRSDDGTTLDGVVALWDLGAQVNANSPISVAGQWTRFATTLNRPARQFRAEVYLTTAGRYLDVAGPVVV